MSLRPIDAIFVHPKRRLYVVYYRGELWQLPRMKIDDKSWQHRKPYTDDSSGLYLSIHQAISDPALAQKLRTLNLPVAVRGSTLPRFEAWWEANGFKWLKDKLTTGESPLAAHETQTIASEITPTKITDNQVAIQLNNDIKLKDSEQKIAPVVAKEISTDIFADMLADLANEVLHLQ